MDPSPPAIHVLAINDDPAILAIYAELLAEEGYRVTAQLRPCLNTTDVRDIAPDVIVLDLLMGREDRGTAFLAMLKADPATRDLPVLVCSADTPRLDELEHQLGIWDCGVVEKPFDIDDFLAAVRACVEERSSRRPIAATAETAAD